MPLPLMLLAALASAGASAYGTYSKNKQGVAPPPAAGGGAPGGEAMPGMENSTNRSMEALAGRNRPGMGIERHPIAPPAPPRGGGDMMARTPGPVGLPPSQNPFVGGSPPPIAPPPVAPPMSEPSGPVGGPRAPAHDPTAPALPDMGGGAGPFGPPGGGMDPAPDQPLIPGSSGDYPGFSPPPAEPMLPPSAPIDMPAAPGVAGPLGMAQAALGAGQTLQSMFRPEGKPPAGAGYGARGGFSMGPSSRLGELFGGRRRY